MVFFPYRKFSQIRWHTTVHSMHCIPPNMLQIPFNINIAFIHINQKSIPFLILINESLWLAPLCFWAVSEIWLNRNIVDQAVINTNRQFFDMLILINGKVVWVNTPDTSDATTKTPPARNMIFWRGCWRRSKAQLWNWFVRVEKFAYSLCHNLNQF